MLPCKSVAMIETRVEPSRTACRLFERFMASLLFRLVSLTRKTITESNRLTRIPTARTCRARMLWFFDCILLLGITFNIQFWYPCSTDRYATMLCLSMSVLPSREYRNFPSSKTAKLKSGRIRSLLAIALKSLLTSNIAKTTPSNTVFLR